MITVNQASYLISDINEWKTVGDDTQYWSECKDGELTIVFPGSNSKVDWRNNFSFWKRPYKQMDTTFFVHRGFLKCWKLIDEYFKKVIEDSGCTSINIVGHSYGGAIAILCAEHVWFNFPALRGKINLITFGAPRVIGFYNYKKIKERWEGAKLITNGTDIVTMIPFSCMGYRHVAKQIHIGKLRNLMDVFRPQIYHDIRGYQDTLNKVL